MRALSRDELQRVDRTASEKIGLPSIVLMENAARQIADAIEDYFTVVEDRPIAVVAGSGNNGGDGLAAARHLIIRSACPVVFLIAPREKLSGDAGINLRAWEQLGGSVRDFSGDKVQRLAGELKNYELVVDAVGGTGIKGALRGELAEAVGQINAAGRPVGSIDVPTGLDCDDGPTGGPIVKAAFTVTMVAPKKGFQADGATEYTGQIVVADIGVPGERTLQLAGE